MRFRWSWVVVIEVTLVFVTGLVINAASEHLPVWMDDPWLVWPILLAVLVFMIGLTVQLRSKGDEGPAQPPVWNVPARNPNFTGRKEDLARLDKLLRRRATAAVHAIRGMGGVGKTQLAAEFCHLHAKRYDIVWWISSEAPELIPDQLRLLGKALGLEQSTDAAEAVQLLRSHLRQQRRWLLVFDNADSVEHVRPYLPSSPGHVVITTRRAGFDAIGGVLDLDTLDRQESLKLLTKRAPTLSSDQANELADLLGDLPLGLEQAAAYITHTQIPAQEYLDLLRTSPDKLADKGEDGHRSSTEKSLATLWTLSLNQIDERYQSAAQLLAVCAYLSAEAIPLDLFATDTDFPNQLSIAGPDNTPLSHTVGVLIDYSLAHRSHDNITVHRLVQLAVRRHVAAIGTTLPNLQHPLNLAAAVLRTKLPANLYRSPETWPRWRQLVPHILALLSHNDQLGKVDPKLASWLLDRTGTYFQVIGQSSQALPLLERALRIGETVHGPDHPNVATQLSNLALVRQGLGQFLQALPLLERALRIGETVHGPDHPSVAISLGNLAMVLQDLGRPEDAQPLLERALRIDETVYGPDHPSVAISLGNLAMVLKDLRQFSQALPLLERALRIGETVHGPDHPSVATRLSNLALVLQGLGRPENAQPLLERALRIDETVYGPDHPSVAIRLCNLALVLQDLGRPENAQPLLERALRIDETVYGPDHPNVATQLGNLALVLKDLRQFSQALPLLERALRIDETVYRPDHPSVAISLGNLALVLQDLGRPEDAQPLLERALRIRSVQSSSE